MTPTSTPTRGAWCVAEPHSWDYLSSHATEAEALAACPPDCHVVHVGDATPGTLGGLSGSPFEDFLASLERH